MKKEIIRNKCVSFCSQNYYLLKQNCTKETTISLRDKILFDICKEESDYKELKLFYDNAKNQGIDNDKFILVNRINKNYSIKTNEKVTLFHFPKRTSLKLFEWQYPASYSVVGNSNNHSKSEIVFDFLHNSYLYFYSKYVLNELTVFNSLDHINKVNKNYYFIKDLKIIFDNQGHVLFENERMERKYICDSWWSTNDEIIHDLVHMPMIDFGKHYKAFWGA